MQPWLKMYRWQYWDAKWWAVQGCWSWGVVLAWFWDDDEQCWACILWKWDKVDEYWTQEWAYDLYWEDSPPPP